MSNTLISWAEAITNYLLVGSIIAAILVPLAWGIIKTIGIRKQVYRHMIWLYSLLGIAILPAIWLYGPKLTIAVLPTSVDSSVVVDQAPVRFRDPLVVKSEAYSPQTALHTDSVPERAIQKPSPPFEIILAGVWFLGFALMLSRLAIGWYKLNRICRMAAHVPEEACLVYSNQCRLRLRLTSQLPGPVCFGLFQPVILLPNHMYENGMSNDIRMILSHELAHIERRDCWVNLFQRLVESMFFFHPLVWFASRRLTQEREQICDNHVLAEGISAHDYTRLLSQIGEQAIHIRNLQTVALFEGQLLSRVCSLLDPLASRQTKLSRRITVVSALTVLATLLTFGCVRLVAKPNTYSPNENVTLPSPEKTGTEQKKSLIPLCQAAKDGNIEQVKRLIAEGADVNAAEDDTLVTPLLAAADKGHADVVRVLLENGAKVDATDSRGVRAIHRAIWNDHEEMLSTLISHGADLNGQDKSGYAMLHSAAAYGYIEAATLLISKGADVNITDNVGRTPIELAMKYNHPKMVELLLSKGASIPPLHLALFYKDEAKAKDLIEAGADVNENTSYDSTPLHWACKADLGEIAELLIEKGAEVNTEGDLRRSPLSSAIRDSNLSMVQLLIQNGADVNIQDKYGWTILHFAAKEGRKEMAELIIANGADVNITNNVGETSIALAMLGNHNKIVALLLSNGADIPPLHLALYYKDKVKAKELVKAGADINERTPDGRSPLHWACKAGLAEIAELLIEKGADVNAKDNLIWTPLHYAVSQDRHMVSMLITNGAIIDAINRGNKTPLWYAQKEGNAEIADLLLSKGADANTTLERTPLHLAVKQGNQDQVELLLNQGDDVNCKGPYRQTPIELAMKYNHPKIVELLLSKGASIPSLHLALFYKDEAKARDLIEAGANVNEKTSYGSTPLHWACNAGLAEIAELLIEKGADVNAKENWNWTPLHSAVYQGERMVNLLVSHGSDVKAKDGSFYTPLWYAKEEDHSEIVEILTKALEEQEKKPSK